MLLAFSGSVFSTSKPFHIHLFIIMNSICIIQLWLNEYVFMNKKPNQTNAVISPDKRETTTHLWVGDRANKSAQ